MIDITKIEHHRNWCEEQLFTCPARGVCNKMLRSSELYDHLMHHDRNIVLLEDTNELVFTFVNSSENHILVLLKDTKHIVENILKENPTVVELIKNLDLEIKE